MAETTPEASPEGKEGGSDTILEALQADDVDIVPSTSSTAPVKPAVEGEESSVASQKQEEGDTEGKAGETAKAEGEEKPKEEEVKILSKAELEIEGRKRLGLSITEPESVEYLKKERSASADEARRLVQKDKGRDKLLAEKGLKVVDTTDGPKFVMLDNWTAPEIKNAADIYASLSQAEKDLALENPEKYTILVAGKGIESVSRRLEPTMRAEEVRIPDSVKSMLTLEVSGAKDSDGKDLHPDFTDLQPYIDARLDDPSTPEEFKDFMNKSSENYKFGMHLLYGEVHMRVAPLIAAQKDAELELADKKKAAEGSISLTDQGAVGVSRKKGAVSTTKDEADEIINAKEIW